MTPGRQRLPASAQLPRHRHAEPYAAIVLKGGYVEAGDSGRRRVRAGDVIFHKAFEAHANAVEAAGAEVLNLPAVGAGAAAFARVPNPDSIVRLAEADIRAASELLAASAATLEPAAGDWPDWLAHDLANDPNLGLCVWAAARGLAPATVSRGFRSAFGVSPKRFRLEARARNAIERLTASRDGVAGIAAQTGFADQAHLTRTVTALTGRTPSQFR